MNRDKVTELLRNYRYYKMAIRDYETPEMKPNYTFGPERFFTAAPCRTTSYSDMPMGTGSGSRAPTLTGDWTLEDHIEYEKYRYAAKRVEMALELLSDEERSVISLKWMDGLTLDQIGKRKKYSREWVKKMHRRALEKLTICLRFDEVPSIEPNVPVA
ncbi:sigma factor-like helix-turn-helix DNA-binding protein [Paenibacillus contaminans]|uniref:RNA polymerase sigma-70 region 4 domain-containing protein n=1 Tax=Paenibacillus contaminans TaxID=450362 RepID=A0A329MQZ6_9BACL|nr:sigma factor-like helix-turn-helix DNA-binding protein [Paenibacillus contaminans]RAV22214.1 hypothetical protein DQG23_04485 [Paenibacillus contaminans]